MYSLSSGTATDSYWTEETSGLTSGGNGTKTTLEAMADSTNEIYTNWNFTAVWEMGLPKLREIEY